MHLLSLIRIPSDPDFCHNSTKFRLHNPSIKIISGWEQVCLVLVTDNGSYFAAGQLTNSLDVIHDLRSDRGIVMKNVERFKL